MLHIESAICYGVLSSIMIFANKYLLDYWAFNYPIFLVLAQIFVTVLIAFVYDKGLIYELNLNKIQENKYYFLIAFFYSLHSITALKALKGLNIPIYATFKRMNPLINLILSFFMFKEQYNNKKAHSHIFNKVNLCILLMAIGVILAGMGDLKFDPFGYLYCGISVILQAFYFSFIQKSSETSMDSIRTMSITNLYSFPILLLCFFGFQEHVDLMNYKDSPNLSNMNFWICFLFVILCGCLLCFSQIWCTTNNDAITTSVIGVLKSFIHSACGLYFFQAYQNMTNLAIFGIIINLIFGSWYTLLKYMEKDKIKLNDQNKVVNTI